MATNDGGGFSLASPETQAYFQMGSSLIQAWSGNQAASDQLDAIQEAIADQQEQQMDRASVQVGERARKGLEERSQIKNLQSMANIGGTTADEQIQASQQQTNRDIRSIERNLDLSLRRAESRGKQQRSRVSQPNALQTSLKIGGQYMAYAERTDGGETGNT